MLTLWATKAAPQIMDVTSRQMVLLTLIDFLFFPTVICYSLSRCQRKLTGCLHHNQEVIRLLIAEDAGPMSKPFLKYHKNVYPVNCFYSSISLAWLFPRAIPEFS